MEFTTTPALVLPGLADTEPPAYWTHFWNYDAERCEECDCRPWGRWSSLPCGAAQR